MPTIKEGIEKALYVRIAERVKLELKNACEDAIKKISKDVIEHSNEHGNTSDAINRRVERIRLLGNAINKLRNTYGEEILQCDTELFGEIAWENAIYKIINEIVYKE